MDMQVKPSRRNIMFHTMIDLERIIEGTLYLSKWAFDSDQFQIEFEKSLKELSDFVREQKDGKNVNATKELLAVGRAMK